MVVWMLAACTGESPSEPVTVGPEATWEPTERKRFCLYGATEPTDGANPWFEPGCEALPGLVRNPEGDLPGFRNYEFGDMVELLIDALDTDGDGLVTDDDSTIVDLLGYSWGGMNATRIDPHADERVQTDHALIGRMALIDPFVPPAGVLLPLEGEVEAVWSYRRTSSPDWDCSALAPLGPYEGRPLDCSTTDGACTEYDLSIDRVVGHCTIVPEVIDWAVENVLTGESPAPEALIVP